MNTLWYKWLSMNNNEMELENVKLALQPRAQCSENPQWLWIASTWLFTHHWGHSGPAL